MSYEIPRPAKIKVPIKAKVVGKDEFVDYRPGKTCKVQRDPTNTGQFVIYFEYNKSKGKAIIAKFDAKNLPETIEYTDGRGNL
jgi:hypothetical protein